MSEDSKDRQEKPESKPASDEFTRPFGEIPLDIQPEGAAQETIQFVGAAVDDAGDPDAHPYGTLYMDSDGILKFDGNMAESAKVLFDEFLKPMCDKYIEERLEKTKEILRKYGRHLRRCELVKQPYLSNTDASRSCNCGFSEALNCELCEKKGYIIGLPMPKGGFYTGHCPDCGKV